MTVLAIELYVLLVAVELVSVTVCIHVVAKYNNVAIQYCVDSHDRDRNLAQFNCACVIKRMGAGLVKSAGIGC